jgi:glycosyltransferase involved in cell wall biosynthesis
MILENCSYLRDARVGKEAKALKENGYRVSVISPELDKLPSRILIDDIAIYSFPQLSFGVGTVGYLLEYLYATLAIAVITAYLWLTQGFDIVHIANPPDCLILVTSVYKLIGKRLIYDQHDLSPELYVARFSSPSQVLARIQFLLERFSYKLADHVIVTNESCRKIAIDRGGLSESKVTVVRNGPAIEQFQALAIDAELRRKAPTIIAFAGITGYQDGLDYLCRALRSLRCEIGKEDFYCIVLGDGDALSYIKNYARELAIDDKVWFAGWVSEPDSYCRYLFTADICVAPEPSNSYNDRSTFVKIMEYMAARRPIVAFDLPENRFSAGDAALYAVPNSHQEFAAKLAELMDNEALRHSMGERGRRRIETGLAWQHSIPDLLTAYDLISKPQNGRALPAKA